MQAADEDFALSPTQLIAVLSAIYPADSDTKISARLASFLEWTSSNPALAVDGWWSLLSIDNWRGDPSVYREWIGELKASAGSAYPPHDWDIDAFATTQAPPLIRLLVQLRLRPYEH